VASTNPSGRVARIEEIVDAVRYLALATYTVGADLVVDGGAAA
jgi:NAD(P)-dependent dehydrogenase (short-subunit alcohol dehydrogenase family)